MMQQQNVNQDIMISARLPQPQLLAGLEQAAKGGGDIVIEGADIDSQQEIAWWLSQYDYRCIDQEADKRHSRYARLPGDARHIVITATNDNIHFLQPVINLMREQGHRVSQISMQGLTAQRLTSIVKHCDVAWFEWGDGAIIPASKMPKYCRIVCRIHAYELYGNAFLEANWENVDEVVLVSEAMKQRFIQLLGKRLPASLTLTVLANMTEHRPLAVQTPRRHRFNLACVARFVAQKNLPLLLPIMQALVQKDRRYTLYIAGRIEDHCLYASFGYLVKVYGLEKNIVICGTLPASEMAKWYQDKSCILSTSYHESQGMAIFEAMLAGLKPVVFHAAGGLAEYLPEKYLFTDINEAVCRVLDDNMPPEHYAQEAWQYLQQDSLAARYPAIWQAEKGPHPLVSIVIPTYNREKFLLPAVCSALNQRDDNFEVVVVDDGSTDDSLAKLEQINDPRLRVIPTSHTNAPDTRNRGIEEARGEYIIWLDSDDLLHPNALSHYRRLLARHPQVDVISCGLEIHGQENQYYSLNNRPPMSILPQIIHGNSISNPGCCVRKALYQQVGGYDPACLRAHDYEFWSRAAGVAKVMFTAHCNITYRLHDGNLTGIGKPVDQTYEYRIFDNMVKRYGYNTLFAGVSRKEAKQFVESRLRQLREQSDLDCLLIVINGIDKPIPELLKAIKLLAVQQDKAFKMVIVASKPLPLGNNDAFPVVIDDAVRYEAMVDYARAVFPDRYCRIFQLNDRVIGDDRQRVAGLKQALLEGSPIPSAFLPLPVAG